jgi:cell division septum initiation protein DivIVA
VFEDAQKAADQYVSEIRRIKEDTEKQAKDILQKARKKAGQDE